MLSIKDIQWSERWQYHIHPSNDVHTFMYQCCLSRIYSGAKDDSHCAYSTVDCLLDYIADKKEYAAVVVFMSLSIQWAYCLLAVWKGQVWYSIYIHVCMGKAVCRCTSRYSSVSLPANTAWKGKVWYCIYIHVYMGRLCAGVTVGILVFRFLHI